MMINPQNIRLRREGAIITIKDDTPDEKLDSKKLLANIDHFKQQGDKIAADIKQIEEQLPLMRDNLEKNNVFLKMFKEHEAWAEEVQHSKVRAIIDKIKDEMFNKVTAEYIFDPTLTNEGNDMQKFRIYQKYLSTHKLVAEEIAPSIMKKDFYEYPVFENPWVKQ